MILRICLAVSLFFSLTIANAQEPCGADFLEKKQQQDPVAAARRNAFKTAAANYLASHPQQRGGVRIIPVVFHIFHENGPENISKAQVLDQMRVLNEDFRRTNADAANTPAVFQTVAADCNIEFRLAQLDPDGNCTDGIVRVFTPLTRAAGDDVKALSSWDNDRYLNIWVVKNIFNFIGGAGTILGYAYYPGSAPFGSDGIIVRADCIGSAGYVMQRARGRTSTHEIGHYLDLAHIWGDQTCGDDQVFDTPTAHGPNYGCPQFPSVSSVCMNGPNGEMFMDYMDYSDDVCMNTFTEGQKQRMDATFANFRSILVDPSNLASTGVMNVPVACSINVDFRADKRFVCAGESVKFTDQSWNSDAASRHWQIPGVTIAAPNDSITVVTFLTPGWYDVKLDEVNASGTYTSQRDSFIYVMPAPGTYPVPYTEGFEQSFAFGAPGWEQISNGKRFVKTTIASFSGLSSLMLDHTSGTDTSVTLILPSFDCTFTGMPQMTFDLAQANRVNGATSSLTVEVSADCGVSWQQRFVRRASALTTVQGLRNGFVPQLNEWQHENVSLIPGSGKADMLVRFNISNNGSDRLYLDNINITGNTITALPEVNNVNELHAEPNPAFGSMNVSAELLNAENVILELTDITGRIVFKSNEGILSAGSHSFSIQSPGAGIYVLRVNDQFIKISFL